MIYLDNAATSSPKPRSVLEEYARAPEKYAGNPGRSGHALSLASSDMILRSREAIARLIGCDTEESIVFTENATYAINMMLRATVRHGDHILISPWEHNSVLRPVAHMARTGYATYSILDATKDPMTAVSDALSEKTRVLVITHVSNVTGYILPIKEYITAAKRAGLITILDASQSVGHIPVNMRDIGCDALCAPCHKGMFGVMGAGFCAVREGLELSEVILGGSGSHSLSLSMPDSLPDRMEAGTLPTPAIAAAGAGARFLLSFGVPAVEEKERSLSERLHERLREERKIELFSHGESGICAFRVTGKRVEDTAEYLTENGIYVRAGYHCSPLAHKTIGSLDTGLIRASIGLFNTARDVDTLATKVISYARTE